ncbi:MAG: 30S ribosomal protein S6, partial [Planctomycetia bacterium]
YEGMFILDPAKYSRDPAGSAQQVADIITQNGGTILAARLWDERKLAYPIKGHKKGVYWLTYFRMEGGNLTALERQCEITDDIIRKLVLRVDPRIADALVQHALAGDTAARRPAPAVAAEAVAEAGGTE